MDSSEALSALNAQQDAQRALAAAATCPPWRHAVFGLIMGALVLSPAVEIPYRFVVLALVLVAIPVIIRSDRRRTGVCINGYRRGKTLLVTSAMLVAVLALIVASTNAVLSNGDRTTPLLLAAVATVVATLGSVLWQRVFVREMGA